MPDKNPRNTTIAAVATPPGRGGVGIVRVSGPLATAIAQAVLNRLPAPRHALFTAFLDAHGEPIDQGIALFFRGPQSFTGEDVLELQGHGGPVVLDLLLRRVIALGACLARPGEFSERAFLNGKLDLVQAEAVADLIESGSASAARSAMRSLEGAFSREVSALVEALTDLRAFVESAIDFPDEEIDFLAEHDVGSRAEALAARIAMLLATTQQGCLLREGLTVVIMGRPNAGKSSLLNALVQADAAIVSDIPGTTRDTLREHIHIDGLPLHIVDTAGLRAAADDIEREGVRRTRAAIARADHALLMLDDSGDENEQTLLPELPPGLEFTVVRNKIDLSGRAPGVTGHEVAVSAKTGAGLDALRARLKACAGYQSAGEGVFMARRRHLDAIRRAQASLAQGLQHYREAAAGELLAEELRQAQQALGEITGAYTSDDLLGRIFSSFCIGK